MTKKNHEIVLFFRDYLMDESRWKLQEITKDIPKIEPEINANFRTLSID